MLNDIFPNICNNRYLNESNIDNDDYILIYKDAHILLINSDNNGFITPQKKDLIDLIDFSSAVFAFSLNDKNCFIIFEDFNINSDNFIYEEIFKLRYYNQKEIAWIGNLGYQLYNWYNENRFCGKCGNKTDRKDSERAIICKECGNIVYPKISPAVIVAISCKNRVLLARGRNRKINFYSLIAGFVEIGETFEEAVKREVKEETGLDVFNLKYYKSQPWPISNSIMIGYFAEADDTQTISIDENELLEVDWFSFDNLPNHAPNLSIAGEMIEYLKNKRLLS